MNGNIGGLSPSSTKKLIESADSLKRQQRVADVFRVIDNLKLPEMGSIELAKEAEKLPLDSDEKRLVEGPIENVSVPYQGLSPTNAGIGGAVGAAFGGIIGLLIARATGGKNYIAWAGVGSALGGAVGGLIGSLWDS